MPKLPTIFANAQDQLSVAPIVSAGRARAGAIADAGNVIGQAVDKGVEQYRQYQQTQDAVDSAKALTDATVHASQDLQKRIAAADPNDATVIPKWREETDQRLQAAGANLRTDAGKANFEIERTKTLGSIELEGIKQQTHLAGEQAAVSNDANTDTLSKQAFTNPENASMLAMRAVGNIEALSSANPVAFPKALKDKEIEKATQSVYDNGGDGLLARYEHNPNVTPDQVDALRAELSKDDNLFKQGMSPPAYKAMMTRVDKLAYGAGNVQAEIAAQALGDVNQAIRDGDLSKVDQAKAIIVQGGGKKTSADMQVWQAGETRKVEDSAAFGAAKNWGTTHTDTDLDSAIANLKTARGTASADDTGPIERQMASLTKFKQERTQAMQSDAAGYVIKTYPTVQGAYESFQNHPDAKTFNAYATAQAGMQNTIAPGQPVRVLPADFKNGIKTQMMGVDQTPEGAAKAGQVLQSLQDVTGPYYNNAVHELEKDHILTGSQFAAAQIMGTPQGFALGQEILRADSMKESDLQATSGATQWAAEAKMRTALAPLSSTFADTINGHELMAAYIKSGAQIMRARGKDSMTDQTASDLANTMVMNRFNIRNNLRIPKNLDDHDVANGADIVQSKIGSRDIIPPASFSGLGDGLQKDAYVRDVQDYGYWSTNDKGDGAVLRYQGLPVYERSGPAFDYKSAAGMKSAGNLDPWNRPVLYNPDGSYSTTSSMSIGTDKGETLIPTVVNGKRLSKADAIAHFKTTGENFGSFDTPANADKFATALHNAQATMYDAHGKPLPRMQKPVEVKFDDLQTAGSQNRSVYDVTRRLVMDPSSLSSGSTPNGVPAATPTRQGAF